MPHRTLFTEKDFSLDSGFPTLSFAKEADIWLNGIKGKSITAQLRERKIYKVKVGVPIPADGFLVPEGGRFIVEIFYFDSKTSCLTLGHEIAHTFHFDLQSDPLKSKIPIPRMFEQGKLASWRIIEKFCDDFSRIWVDLNGGTKKVFSFFEKNRRFVFIESKILRS